MKETEAWGAASPRRTAPAIGKPRPRPRGQGEDRPTPESVQGWGLRRTDEPLPTLPDISTTMND
jgi:hypothetical protein